MKINFVWTIQMTKLIDMILKSRGSKCAACILILIKVNKNFLFFIKERNPRINRPM